MYVNAAGMLVGVCIVPLIVMMVVEYRQRGPRPSNVSLPKAVASLSWTSLVPGGRRWSRMAGGEHAGERLACRFIGERFVLCSQDGLDNYRAHASPRTDTEQDALRDRS